VSEKPGAVQLLLRICNDLKNLKNKPGLTPELIILTGDLAEWGRKSEFNDVLRFVQGLADYLGLSRQRIAIVPGNHDINRDACESYFKECEANEAKRVWLARLRGGVPRAPTAAAAASAQPAYLARAQESVKLRFCCQASSCAARFCCQASSCVARFCCQFSNCAARCCCQASSCMIRSFSSLSLVSRNGTRCPWIVAAASRPRFRSGAEIDSLKAK
jgi:hypothetical protein